MLPGIVHIIITLSYSNANICFTAVQVESQVNQIGVFWYTGTEIIFLVYFYMQNELNK